MINPYQNPTIYIGNLRVDEPITSITNIIFAAICLFAFINTKNQKHRIAANIYRWFILAIGFSAVVAAFIGHAFLYRFGFSAKIYGWEANVLGVAVAQTAAVYHFKQFIKSIYFKILLVANYIEIVVAFILTYTVFSFTVVEIHSAIGLLLFVSLLESVIYKKTKSALSKYMLLGVGVVVLTVFVHVFKLAISVWFNHLDLSHVLMCISIYFFYKGIKQYKPYDYKPAT